MAHSPRKTRTPYRDCHGIDDDYRPGKPKASRVKKGKKSRKPTSKLILRLRLGCNPKAPVLIAMESKVDIEGDIAPPALPNPPITSTAKKMFDSLPLHPMEYGPHEQPETEPFPTIDFAIGEPYTENHWFLHCEHQHCSRVADRQKHSDYYHGARTVRPHCTCKRASSRIEEAAHDWKQLADDEIFVIQDEATQIIHDIKQTTCLLTVDKLLHSRNFFGFRSPLERNVAARAARDYFFAEIDSFFKRCTSGTKNASFIDTPKNLKYRMIACLGLKLLEYIEHHTPLRVWIGADPTFSVAAGVASEMVTRYPLAELIWNAWTSVLEEIMEGLINAQKLHVIEATMTEALDSPKGTKRKMAGEKENSSMICPTSKRPKKATMGLLNGKRSRA